MMSNLQQTKETSNQHTRALPPLVVLSDRTIDGDVFVKRTDDNGKVRRLLWKLDRR